MRIKGLKKEIKDSEKISVVVPIYNVKEQYLRQCIESIIEQTYNNIEIILIDDGSNNNCKLICKEYENKDKRIVVVQQKNQGVSVARNNGVKIATGQWITFIDADDYIEHNFCKMMLDIANKTNSQCVICAYNRVYNSKIEKVIKKDSFFIDNEQFLKNILSVQSGFGFCHMKLWKADIIKNNNVQFNKELKVAEDALFCMEMSKYIEKVYFLNETLYNYRFNSNSVVRKFDNQYVDKYLKAMQIEREFIQKTWTNYEQEVYNYIMYHVLLIVINYCFHPKNENKGIKILKEVCNIEEFKKAINYSNYNGLSLTRKVTVWTLKCKLYVFTSIIANIRQYQFTK